MLHLSSRLTKLASAVALTAALAACATKAPPPPAPTDRKSVV